MNINTTEMTLDQAFGRAYQLQQSGQLQQAEQLYCQIIQAQPHFHMAWYQLGLMAVDVGKLPMAAELISKASDCRPVEFIYHRALCEIYRRLQDLDRARHHGRQATKHGEHDADSHYNFGLALFDAKNFKSAIGAYKRAISLNPRHGLAYNNLGSCYEQIDDEGAAYDAYSKAIEIDPNHSEAQHNLGAILNERGRIEEAKQRYIASINANPNFVYAHQSLSALKRYSEDDPHLEMLEDLAPKISELNHEMQTKFWFALGKAREDVGKYKESFYAYKKANSLHRQTYPFNIDDSHSCIKSIIEGFDNDVAERKVNGCDDDTPIFILGMPRSGSTLIEQILDSHSQIHGAGELSYLSDVIYEVARLDKDIPYIDWIKTADEDVFQDIGHSYIERLRKHSDNALRIVDKMPGNFFYVGLIHKILPNAKIIHSMRNPIDICISNYTRLFKQIIPFAYDLNELGQYCRLSDDMMKHWKAILPKDFIIGLQYEELVNDLEGKAKELIDFCGLEWEESSLEFYRNTRVVKTASHNQVNKPIYKTSVERWKKYEDYIQPLIDGYNQR